MKCRVPACPNDVYNKKWNLCERHYDRAKARQERNLDLTMKEIVGNLAWLSKKWSRVQPRKVTRPEGAAATSLSCLTCDHFRFMLPRFFECGKKKFPDGIRRLAVEAVERNGLPNCLVGYGRLCPEYRGYPANLVPRKKSREWSRIPVE